MIKVYYAKAVYDKKEISAVNEVLKNPISLMNGPKVREFENKARKLFGKRYALMVNSGSSANLLALTAFNFKPGSEIITPSLTFSTTVAPIYQINCIPHFIDVLENEFTANVDQIERCINKKTVAIFIPNLLGNIADWKGIFKIAQKYNLKVIEDSADTIGYSYNNSNTGLFSDVVTTSFYGAHLITGAGFGGLVCFNDLKLYKNAKMLREYGRTSALFTDASSIKSRFKTKIGQIEYDNKYIFSEVGYNFLPSEISAAFALEQLKKLKLIIKKRIRNFKKLKNFFIKYPFFFRIPSQKKNIKTGWLAYPILLSKNCVFKRNEFQAYLEKAGIQTRPIFSGNIIRQPMVYKKKFKKQNFSSIVSDDVMSNGVLVGCHHGLKEKEINYILNTVRNFINKYKN